MGAKKQADYILDGVNLKEYGVYVSGSDGILNRPKIKTPLSLKWDDYHGESVDLVHKYYEPREITLSCFVKAQNKSEFIARLMKFERAFDKPGMNRLVIDVHPDKPLIYEVYCKETIQIQKEWSDDVMVGTFKLKLVEPEPFKKVLKHIRTDETTKDCSITLTSSKFVNIFWGDGSVDYDVNGDNRTLTHEYKQNGIYYPVITGCIDEITSLETESTIVWERI